MDTEFLDPGPDQPWTAPPVAPPRQLRAGLDRESIGLLVLLAAAAALPVIAAYQTYYSVDGSRGLGPFGYVATAWGQMRAADGSVVSDGLHEPRFGALLCLAGAGYAMLALLLAASFVRRPPGPSRSTLGAAAAAATGLSGLMVGVLASMSLEIGAVFDRLTPTTVQPLADGVLEVHLRVGSALWFALAGLLAGGLAVTATVRLRARLTDSVAMPIEPAEAGY